jgi:hypothetical protein
MVSARSQPGEFYLSPASARWGGIVVAGEKELSVIRGGWEGSEKAEKVWAVSTRDQKRGPWAGVGVRERLRESQGSCPWVGKALAPWGDEPGSFRGQGQRIL